MTENKHTPGPWTYEESVPSPTRGGVDDIITDPGGYVLAIIFGQSPGDGPLMAAALDLLAACEDMMAYVGSRAAEWNATHKGGDFYREISAKERELVDGMRAAIARAHGTMEC